MTVLGAPPAGRTRRIRPALATDIGMTLGVLTRGPRDPVTRLDATGAWRALRTPDGPATLRLAPAPGGEIEATAWGPGSAWALDEAPALLGGGDDPAGFNPRHPLLAALHRRFAPMRLCRTGTILDTLTVAVLEQKVTGYEAAGSWFRLLRALGEPAPGPRGGLIVPPSPERLRTAPTWTFHLAGVEARRAGVLRRAAARAARLEECTRMPPEHAGDRLMTLWGVGPWTAAQVRHLALGDPDAVPVGDYNLPNIVCHALAGVRQGDDATMLELLEPYRGHRARVLRLLVAGGVGPPRRGPRMAPRNIARL